MNYSGGCQAEETPLPLATVAAATPPTLTTVAEAPPHRQPACPAYYGIIEQICDYVYSVNFNDSAVGSEVRHNPRCRQLTGYAADELAASASFWLDIVHGDDHAQVESALDAMTAASDSAISKVIFRIQHKSGACRWLELTMIRHHDPRRRFSGYDAAVKDITTLKNAQQRLQQLAEEREHAARDLAQSIIELTRSNKMQERFSFIAAHHIREPLRVIVLQAQLMELRHKAEIDGETLQCLQHINHAGQHLNALLNDLLRYSQLRHCHGAVERVDCEALLRQLLQQYQRQLDAVNAEVSITTPLPSIDVVGKHLHIVFECLLSNAIKFRSSAPLKISISSTADGPFHVFTVADNGIGIESCFHQRIFMLFERLHWQHEGSGAGLAICKRIIDEHGGKIWVESALGQGARFNFRIPQQLPTLPWQEDVWAEENAASDEVFAGELNAVIKQALT